MISQLMLVDLHLVEVFCCMKSLVTEMMIEDKVSGRVKVVACELRNLWSRIPNLG
ncbi:hypothetical protein Hanom_Chr00s000532g01648331 [Helianthus anomalus]